MISGGQGAVQSEHGTDVCLQVIVSELGPRRWSQVFHALLKWTLDSLEPDLTSVSNFLSTLSIFPIKFNRKELFMILWVVYVWSPCLSRNVAVCVRFNKKKATK